MPGVSNAGGRRAGSVAEGVRHRGDAGGLRRDAGAGAGMRVKSQKRKLVAPGFGWLPGNSQAPTVYPACWQSGGGVKTRNLQGIRIGSLDACDLPIRLNAVSSIALTSCSTIAMFPGR